MYLLKVSSQIFLLALLASSLAPSLSKPAFNPKPKVVLQESSIEYMISLNMTQLPSSIDNLIKNAKILCSKELLDLQFGNLDMTLIGQGHDFDWDKFDETCSKIKGNIVKKAERFRNRITDKYINRHGRSLDWLGTFWGDLSGNPKPADKARYENNFVLIKQRAEKQANFDEKVLESENIMTKLIDDHNQRLLNMSKETTVLLEKIRLTESNELALISIMAMVSTLNEWFDHLLETEQRADQALNSGKSGFLSPLLLSPSELAHEIVEIQASERFLAPIFGKNNIHSYYDFPFVKIHQTEGFLHFVLTISLIDPRIELTLEHIHKDIKAKSAYELEEFEYLATSADEKDFFILLTENELDDCLETENRVLLCTHRKARLSGSGNLGDRILHDIDETSFISKYAHSSNATLKCNDTTEIVQLPGESVLKVPLECSLSSPQQFFIPKHQSRKIELKWNKFEINEMDFEKLQVFDKETKHNTTTQLDANINAKKIAQLEKNHEEMKTSLKEAEDKNDFIAVGTSSHGGISLIMFAFLAWILIVVYRQSRIIAQTTTNVQNYCGWLSFGSNTASQDLSAPKTPKLPSKSITQTNL